jgi:hypothetical protein
MAMEAVFRSVGRRLAATVGDLESCCGGAQRRLVIDGDGSAAMDLQSCSGWRQLLSSGS